MAKRLTGKRAGAPWWRGAAVYAAVFLAALCLVLGGIESAREGNRVRELKSVERAVNRAVVSCYAMEGFYPPSIDYLIENYGLTVDAQRYYIRHEAFASNIYPVIEVYERG